MNEPEGPLIEVQGPCDPINQASFLTRLNFRIRQGWGMVGAPTYLITPTGDVHGICLMAKVQPQPTSIQPVHGRMTQPGIRP